MWQSIRRLTSEGITVFLTTQYLEEADKLADRIAVLDEGRLVAEGTPGELKRRIPGGHVSLRFTNEKQLEGAAAVLGRVVRVDDALALQVPSDGDVRALRSLLDQLEQHSIEVDSLAIHEPDLDDVFFAFTGGPAPREETTS